MAALDLVTHTLDNGLRVVVHADGIAPVVAVNLWYDVGSRHERGHQTGLAHLFEHLMFQGSRHVAATEHFGLLQAVGGSLNGTTSFDRTNYFETVPAHALDLALWLEADRMGTLLDALTQENLDNQRDVVKNERRQRMDNVPYGHAWERTFAALYPEGHPYHHMPIGSMAHLDAVTVDDCREFFRRSYAPANAVISIVGDVDPVVALDRVEHFFGAIPTLEEPLAARDGTVAPREEPDRQVVREPVPVATRYLSWRIPPDRHEDNDALDVALEVLQGGGASRLTRRAVRGEQLAQSIGGGVQGLVGGTDAAALIVRARTDADPARLYAVVDEEIARLAVDLPTDEEIERARARMTRSWLDRLSTVMGRADELSGHATLHGDPTLVDDVDERLAAVTSAQVGEVVQRWLRPEQRVVVDYEPVSA